jgi:hypothetical protein
VHGNWPGKREADRAFDELRYRFKYRANYDQDRAAYLLICYARLASPKDIEAAATQEIRDTQMFANWLVGRFPASGAAGASAVA